MPVSNAQKTSTSFQQSGLVLFISDLHLCESRPQITQAFLQFLKTTAKNAQALYILGDLFEYWAGDDDLALPFHQTITQAFAALSKSGVQIYFMHGNRDFLIADKFCKAADLTLLPDPTLVTCQQQTVLLSHGDALCTDDRAYQTMRVQFRNPVWQKTFLNQPLSARKAQIANIRMQSAEEKSKKSMEIMDVNTEAVTALLQSFNYPPLFIHGHTHRPAQHSMTIDGHAITRWVLGDWYEQGSYLALDKTGCYAARLPS